MLTLRQGFSTLSWTSLNIDVYINSTESLFTKIEDMIAKANGM